MAEPRVNSNKTLQINDKWRLMIMKKTLEMFTKNTSIINTFHQKKVSKMRKKNRDFMISMTFKKNPVMPPNVSHDQETWPGKVTPLATNCESGDAFPHRRLSTLQHLIDATGQRAGPVQSLQVKNGLHTLKIDLLNPKNWLVSRCVSFSRAFSQVSEVCRQTS